MSEVPQGTGPNLHAIFGIDTDQALEAEHIVEIDRNVEVDRASGADLAVELDHAVETERVEEVGSDLEIDVTPEEGKRAGITGPSRRGSSPRFLTDVIVDLGLVSRR